MTSPSQVKNLRGRYGSAGSKDDRFDTHVMADTLRTDRARLAPPTPGNPAVVSLRRACRARKGLVAHRVALANQLRAHRRNAFSSAVGLFAETGSPISLRFLARFESQDRADWLSPRGLAARLASLGCSGRTDPAVLHRRLAAASPDDDGAAQTCNTPALLTVLTTLAEQIKALAEQIAEQLSLHADAHIFTSLSRSGTVRAARLLAGIGDCRARFLTPEALACLAGTASSTWQFGKMHAVTFRCSCGKQLRDAVTDFTDDSRHASSWTPNLYNKARTRGHDHPHAVRILARAWLFVIWPCWQNRTAYDPAKHPALQSLLNQNQQAAA